MIDLASLVDLVSSVSVIGFVLVEALVLYVAYGVVFERAGDDVKSALADE